MTERPLKTAERILVELQGAEALAQAIVDPNRTFSPNIEDLGKALAEDPDNRAVYTEALNAIFNDANQAALLMEAFKSD